jgi:hypothetical protein
MLILFNKYQFVNSFKNSLATQTTKIMHEYIK